MPSRVSRAVRRTVVTLASLYVEGVAAVRLALKARTVAAVARAISTAGSGPADLDAGRLEVVRNNSRMAVALCPRTPGPGYLVVKVGTDRASADDLRAECRTLAALQADRSLEEWWPYLPERLVSRPAGRRPYSVDASPSRTTAWMARDPALRDASLADALAVIGDLHRRSLRREVATEATVRRLLGGRQASVETTWPRGGARGEDGARMRRLGAALTRSMVGRTVELGWVHGDYWLDNVLVEPESGKVVRVIDWGEAACDDLVGRDGTLAVLSAHCRDGGVDLNAAVARVVRLAAGIDAPNAAEAILLRRLEGAWPASQDLSVVQGVLVTWTHHVAHLVAKRSPHLLAPGHWVHHRFAPVLAALDDAGGAAALVGGSARP